ncbi:MAG TPA: sigma-70 family RNA polymerase sigma factor [Cytophagales bacterium]|jgi:RNA polymerase sigma-70 factor (ECF subfamily)|nr:sigma-70 family RNA polymerase sigma factor [Cytophagales bacterium]
MAIDKDFSVDEQNPFDSKQFSEKALQDFKLIDQAKEQGDQKAYAELMKRYKKPLYHTILKMVRNVDDAEDLTIEAFAKAFRSLHKFKKDYTFSTWLFRIATNNCIDFIRKKRLETTSISASYRDDNGEDVSMDIKDANLNPQEEAIKGQKIEIMQLIITKLPPKYQTLVNMRYFRELSYEEIAEELQAPLGTVKAQLHRARELLYDLVKDKKEFI